jgi:hypothetical protein
MVHFKLDSYFIPPLLSCPELGRSVGLPLKRAVSEVAPPVPPSWIVVIIPETLSRSRRRAAGTSRDRAPGFTGTMPINVTASTPMAPSAASLLQSRCPNAYTNSCPA